MKKIAIVAHGLSNGGAERVAALLANKFYEIGYEVNFIAVYSNRREYYLNSNIVYKYIEIKKKNKFSRLFARAKLLKESIEEYNPDIIISFIINEMILVGLNSKIPIIYSLRNNPESVLNNCVNKMICKILYKRAKNVVFQTADAKDYFEKKIKEKGVIIPNPLTPNLPYWNKSNHKKRVITACRLTPQKNLKMLIDAFCHFQKQHSEYNLEIYGDGELKEELEDYTKKLKIDDVVRFPGHSKEIHKIMAESECFVLTSDFEGLSNSMLEALAIGTPTICTDCPPGGAATYITDYKNGMLIPVGDTQELIKRLEELLMKPHLSKEFSKHSVEIRKELEENIIIQKWDDLISENVGEKYE